jgi:gamma-tubulin complex component 2
VFQADAQGGKVLSLLHQNAVKLAGDQEGQLVCLELARNASTPYLKSLDTWLLCGIIEDPFEEVS